MIEAWGRGTIKIVDECKKAGLPEPEFREQFGGLSVHFLKGKSEKKVGGELGEKRGESGVKVGREFEPESNKNSGGNRR